MLKKLIGSLCLGIAGAVVVNSISDKIIGRDDNKVLQTIGKIKDKIKNVKLKKSKEIVLKEVGQQ